VSQENGSKNPPNKQNAGELLIVALFESWLGHNHSDDWWYICQPAIV
jgi:hypothetical protein